MNNTHYAINYFGINIEVSEIICFLRESMQIKKICQKILYQKITERTAWEQGITVTLNEIQTEEDRLFRDEISLEDTDFYTWLEEQVIDLEDWQANIRNHLLAKKLANHLFALSVEMFFNLNASDFDQAVIYKIVVPSVELAQQILYQIQANEISFYEAAHLYDIDEKRRHQCGYEGKVYRWNLQPNIAMAIFSATPGQVIGPFQTHEGNNLLMIEEFIPAELNTQSYQDVLTQLFERWLEMELNYLIHSNGDTH